MSGRSRIEQELRAGDIDAAIIVRVFDLSSDQPQEAPFTVFDLSPHLPNSVQIIFQPPRDDDGTINPAVTAMATATDVTTLDGYVGDGSDGYAQFRTPDAAFLTPAGKWEWQVRIFGVPPGDYKSQIVRRVVHPNL